MEKIYTGRRGRPKQIYTAEELAARKPVKKRGRPRKYTDEERNALARQRGLDWYYRVKQNDDFKRRARATTKAWRAKQKEQKQNANK